jgi:hypothetical protein
LTFLAVWTEELGFERVKLMEFLCPGTQSESFILPGMVINLVNHFLVFLFKKTDG